MVNVIFHNVGIGISARTPEEAYTKLCNLLKTTEFSTDTYTVEESVIQWHHDTSELFPKPAEVNR